MYTIKVDRKKELAKSKVNSWFKRVHFYSKTESSHTEYNTKFDQKSSSIEPQFDFLYLNN